jgi:hypothetical protein
MGTFRNTELFSVDRAEIFNGFYGMARFMGEKAIFIVDGNQKAVFTR